MKKAASKAFVGIVLAVLAIVTLLPVIWVLISSLKTRKEMMTLPWGLPEVFQWENYTKAWADRAYREGANILILSDRGIDENHVPIPSLLAVSALQQYRWYL